MPRCVADFFIVYGFVVNSAVLLCGFKQTKGKRYENSDSFDRFAAGISGGVCVNHLWPVVAGGGGMKDEALKLASALDHWATQMDMGRKPDPKSLIRKASAELRRLQAELDAVKQALAAPVQEPVAWWNGEYGSPVFAFERDTPGIGLGNPDATPLYTTPPAHPAVPDAIHHTDLSEHPQYIEGWNDCRAEMLKGMK
jgi:hypothetical protein